jgi:hypothetical protein
LGKEPDKEFKGTFNIRISPELHRKAALKANQLGISLNQLVSDAIEHELSGNQKTIREIIYIESEKQVEWSLAAYPFQNYSTASEVNFSREGAYTNARN